MSAFFVINKQVFKPQINRKRFVIRIEFITWLKEFSFLHKFRIVDLTLVY